MPKNTVIFFYSVNQFSIVFGNGVHEKSLLTSRFCPISFSPRSDMQLQSFQMLYFCQKLSFLIFLKNFCAILLWNISQHCICTKIPQANKNTYFCPCMSLLICHLEAQSLFKRRGNHFSVSTCHFCNFLPLRLRNFLRHRRKGWGVVGSLSDEMW